MQAGFTNLTKTNVVGNALKSITCFCEAIIQYSDTRAECEWLLFGKTQFRKRKSADTFIARVSRQSIASHHKIKSQKVFFLVEKFCHSEPEWAKNPAD